MCVCVRARARAYVCVLYARAYVHVIIKNPQKITIGNNELNGHNSQSFIYNI